MNNQQPTILNGHILVEFEKKPKLNESLDIVAPERFLVQEADEEGETNAWAVTTDRRTINPQIIKVIQGNETVKTDTRCFCHYGCYEIGKWINEEQAIIRPDMVFFELGPPIKPFPGNYLAEEIFVEGERTASGIYTTPIAEAKLPCNVRITHVPDTKELGIINGDERQLNHRKDIYVGDEVVTIDEAQYTLKYEDKKYIKLRESEIIAKVVDGKVIPLNKYLLVEYCEEPDAKLQAENDYKAHTKDVAIKHRLFVPGIDFEPTKPKKEVTAKLLEIGDSVNKYELDAEVNDMLVINRNRGLLLPDGKWIINLDAILFTYVQA